MTTLRTDKTARFARVDPRFAGVKGELVLHRWMPGFVLATDVAIRFELFAP